MLNNSKKAQVGDTVTWIIATVIILVMLFFFVLGSSLLSQTKSIVGYRSSLFSSEILYKYDFFMSKSLYSYHKVSSPKEKISVYEGVKRLPLSEESFKYLDERSSEIKRRLG